MVHFHSFLFAFLFLVSTAFALAENSDFPEQAVVEALNRISVLQEPFSLEKSDMAKIQWARKKLETGCCTTYQSLSGIGELFA